MTENVDPQDAIDLAAAYLETAFGALDRGDTDLARAALGRVAQWLLVLPRWDSVEGGYPNGSVST